MKILKTAIIASAMLSSSIALGATITFTYPALTVAECMGDNPVKQCIIITHCGINAKMPTEVNVVRGDKGFSSVEIPIKSGNIVNCKWKTRHKPSGTETDWSPLHSIVIPRNSSPPTKVIYTIFWD